MNKGPVPMGDYAAGQPYGTGVAMADAQRQMPVAAPAPPTPPQGPPGTEQPAAPSGPAPGSLGSFLGPTQRPNEPITHGLPTGPGGGPEVLGSAVPSPAGGLLQRMAAQPFASDDIRALANILNR